VGGEYAKGWVHFFEQMLGAETDTSELLNEMITAVRPFGRVGLTGVYAGFVCDLSLSLSLSSLSQFSPPLNNLKEYILT
jgi:threonine dehydrogenase-like Zn-dependent dehydrogenase